MQRLHRLTVLLVLGNGSLFACGGEADAPVNDVPRAGAPAPVDAPAGPCTLPADCTRLNATVSLEACCSPQVACGFDYSPILPIFPDIKTIRAADTFFPPGFDPAQPCVARQEIFLERPGAPEKRVAATSGPDILITPECSSRTVAVAAIPFAGCCLPTGACGLSTDRAATMLRALAEGAEAPFTGAECVSSTELNAQLAATTLAALGHFPPTTGSCDYAGLAASLPPVMPKP